MKYTDESGRIHDFYLWISISGLVRVGCREHESREVKGTDNDIKTLVSSDNNCLREWRQFFPLLLKSVVDYPEE